MLILLLGCAAALGEGPGGQEGKDEPSQEEPCSHDWIVTTVEAGCETPGSVTRKCSKCGADGPSETIPALNHDWEQFDVPATCTKDGSLTLKCKRCDKVLEMGPRKAKGHQWEDEKVTKEPTCEEPGKSSARCSVCGEISEEKTLPALGHDWKETEVTATCTQDGSVTRECQRCGKKEEVSSEKAKGHQWEKNVVLSEATCTESGKTVTRCSVCGETTDEVSLPALGHDWVENKSEPTCTDSGYLRRVCQRCGKKEEIKYNPLGHDYSAWEIISNSCVNGMRSRECSRCGMSQTQSIKGSNHDFGPWTASDGNSNIEVRVCSLCGTKETRNVYTETPAPTAAPTDAPAAESSNSPFGFTDAIVINLEETEENNLSLYVFPLCEPGHIFAGNEEIQAHWVLVNTGDQAGVLTGFEITLPDGRALPMEIDEGEPIIMPGEFAEGVLPLSSEVREALQGSEITIRAQVTWDGDQAGLSSSAALSLSLDPQAEIAPVTIGPDMAVAIQGVPEAPQGNTVNIHVLLTNESDYIMSGIRVFDPMGNQVFTFASEGMEDFLFPGKSLEFACSYPITQQDIDRGYVISLAYACWNDADLDKTVVTAANSLVLPLITKTK